MSFDQLDLFGTPVARDVDHNARWTPAILDVIATTKKIPAGARVHDCFAGTGERLGALADRMGWTFTGTELEPEFIVDSRVVVGDATDPTGYPTGAHVVTSPPYPNGMSDHFAAKNPEGRNTYRAAIHRMNGYDRPLHPNNLGRYGYRPGRPPENFGIYWGLAERTVACWTAELVVVNVKDYIHSKTVVEPVVDPWAELLEHHGYAVVDRIEVSTTGNRSLANRHRVDHEVVLIGERG